MRTSFTILTLVLISVLTVDPYLGQAQKSINIKGKVTNDKREPLAGVTVNVKGRNTSAVTDVSGNYRIMVADKNAILAFSFVGLITQEIPVRNQTDIDIQLAPDSKSMEELVVTALNIKRSKKSLGYSIATLDGGEVNKVQTPNLINALSGKVAGVDVGNTASGVAGSKRIVIRGGSSLTGNNQPLWVIDGISISTPSGSEYVGGGIDYGDGLTGINPDDIENISVLKGNAAAALYGSQASNGVILVTTKSGKSAKGKMKADISSSLLLDKLIDLTDYQKDYGLNALHSGYANITDFPVSAEDALSSDSYGHRLDGTPVIQFDGVVRPWSAANNYKPFFNTGSTITNTAALSGGNENHDYRVSVSDLRNTDIIPNANFTRTSLNSKAHSKFGKLDVDLVLNYIYEKANNRPYIGGNHNNQFYSLLYMPPNIDLKTLAPGYRPDGGEFIYASSITNPYYVVNKEKETDINNRLIASLGLSYQINNWLYARGRITRDYYLSKVFQYIPDNNISTDFPLGSLNQSVRENTRNNYEFLLGAHPADIGKFGIDAFVGGNIRWDASTQLITSGTNFVVPGIFTFNNLGNKLPSTSDSKRRTNSLFGSVELSYRKYLYLTLTGRNDWFSTLPTDNNNLLYPSAAFSFIFSDALKMPSWVSFGKFRVSAAQVSGDPDPYQLDLSYSLDPLQFGSLPLQTIATSNIPNRDLKPLLSTDFEIGLEMDFLNGRVGFDASYYKKSIKNDIVVTRVSNTTGYSTAIVNVGKLSDNGVELLVRGTPLKTKNFSWNVTATFSTINSKVISLGSGGTKGANILLMTAKSGYASIQLEEGQPYGGIYGSTYMRDSLGRRMINAQGLPIKNFTEKRLGNSLYNKIMGLSNTFRYKDLSLYIFLDGKFGANIWSETNFTAYSNGKHKETVVGREDGFIADGIGPDGKPNTVLLRGSNSPTGPGAYVPQYYRAIEKITEVLLYDASFVKLREIALSYNLPKSFLNKIRIRDLSVSAVARNLLTLYKDRDLKNVDPESSVSSGNAQGLENMVYPTTRSYGLTIKLGL